MGGPAVMPMFSVETMSWWNAVGSRVLFARAVFVHARAQVAQLVECMLNSNGQVCRTQSAVCGRDARAVRRQSARSPRESRTRPTPVIDYRP